MTAPEAAPEPDIQGMLAEVIQAAKEEGRRGALEGTLNTLRALSRLAGVTEGVASTRDDDIKTYTAGQQAGLDAAEAWVLAELGAGIEED